MQAQNISDALSQADFRESTLYNEYYRRIGIDHALLDLVREPLAALYRNLLIRKKDRGFAALPVTPREREVLSWLAAGKTDRDIGEILGMSPRTVQKHLQHIYQKLGVETRTAAVVRAMELGSAR